MTEARAIIVAWALLALAAIIQLHGMRIAAIYFGLRHFQSVGGESVLPFGVAWALAKLERKR